MKKAIFIVSIAVILLLLATYELIVVDKIITNLKESVNTILPKYEDNKTDITILYNDILAIDKQWEDTECNMCLMFNHKDLSTVTDSLNKVVSYTKNNDYDNAIAEIYLLQGYADKNEHIMGFNIHNVL